MNFPEHTFLAPTRPAPAWLAGVALVAAVFLAYLPAFGAGFVWDDDAHVTRPALRSAAGLARIWLEPGATQQYYPLLHSAFWLEHRLWGDAARGYHLINAAWHALAAILLARVLQRLAVPGACWGALLFAVHPVAVESVAWISEQKNTLSAVCYLAAALAYLRFDATRQRSAYWIAFGWFALGLLTKTVVATLPGALLVVLWWQRGRLGWRRDGLPLLPWFVVGAICGLFTAFVERSLIGAEGATFELSALQRGLLAGHVVWFYFGKLLWPSALTFIYPRWSIDPAAPGDWVPLLALLLTAYGLWRLRRRTRAPLAGLLLFIGSLFPVLGFLNLYPFQYSFVADHFQYLASFGIFALAGAAVGRLGNSSRRRFDSRAILLVAALGWLTVQQAGLFRNNTVLFRATTVRNPTAWMAHNNLGVELMKARPTLGAAIACFERALRLKPDYHQASANLGLALTQSGRAAEGVPHLEAALRLNPHSYESHNNLGIALASSGRLELSLASFRRAARINPRLANIHENWAKALHALGRRDEAAARFAEAARLRTPGSSTAR